MKLDSLSHLRHEVNTPLNAIIGYSEMLLEDPESSGLSEFTGRLQKVHAMGKHLLAIANDVLDPAKIVANRQAENLMALAHEIRDRLAIPLSVIIDSSEWLARDTAASGQADSASDLQKIHVAGKRLQQYLQEIVRPDAQFSSLAAASPASFDRPGQAGARAAAEHGSVLVVDDNEMNRDILSRILMRRGHRVLMASSGREALATVAAQSVDLLLLDILMPEMDGYEVLQQVTANSALAGLPVIFISAFDDLSEKIKAFQSGAVDYITKPFQAEEVLARVDNQLKIRRLQRQLEEQNHQLLRKNAQLVEEQKRTDIAFSALSDVLPGAVLDRK
jgi:CheY-like chemotaxis protein